jgi:hypothetical protein
MEVVVCGGVVVVAGVDGGMDEGMKMMDMLGCHRMWSAVNVG